MIYTFLSLSFFITLYLLQAALSSLNSFFFFPIFSQLQKCRLYCSVFGAIKDGIYSIVIKIEAITAPPPWLVHSFYLMLQFKEIIIFNSIWLFYIQNVYKHVFFVVCFSSIDKCLTIDLVKTLWNAASMLWVVKLPEMFQK